MYKRNDLVSLAKTGLCKGETGYWSPNGNKSGILNPIAALKSHLKARGKGSWAGCLIHFAFASMFILAKGCPDNQSINTTKIWLLVQLVRGYVPGNLCPHAKLRWDIPWRADPPPPFPTVKPFPAFGQRKGSLVQNGLREPFGSNGWVESHLTRVQAAPQIPGNFT